MHKNERLNLKKKISIFFFLILLIVYQFSEISGVLAFDKNTGFWIVSSVPKFPSPVAEGFRFLNSQTKFGQTILCVTVANTVENSLSKLTRF